ncbi:MAG: hypothetical protein Q9168_001726 [Polycauliona sp. 1 TL-2023]
MHRNRSSPRNPNRAVREKFRKRRTSLIKKADELAFLCQADVYLVVYRGEKYYSYSSSDRDDWPPSEEEMARHYPIREHSGPDDVRSVRRSTTRNDDGDISEQSEDPPIPNLHPPNFLPSPYPKRTRCLARPPQLSFAEHDMTAQPEAANSGGGHLYDHQPQRYNKSPKSPSLKIQIHYNNMAQDSQHLNNNAVRNTLAKQTWSLMLYQVTVKVEDESSVADTISQTIESCHECKLQHWRRCLEQQRITVLEHERVRISTGYNTLKTSFQKLQDDHDKTRTELTRLQVALAKKEGDFQAEQHAKNHTILHWQTERESRRACEFRLTQALTTLSQFAHVYYSSRIDDADLTRAQKEALQRMDYAQVVQERDAFRVRCYELQNTERRSRGSFQAFQPCIAGSVPGPVA